MTTFSTWLQIFSVKKLIGDEGSMFGYANDYHMIGNVRAFQEINNAGAVPK